jgi:hypothetical protein
MKAAPANGKRRASARKATARSTPSSLTSWGDAQDRGRGRLADHAAHVGAGLLRVHQSGAQETFCDRDGRLVFDIPSYNIASHPYKPNSEREQIAYRQLKMSDAVIVSTSFLKEQVEAFLAWNAGLPHSQRDRFRPLGRGQSATAWSKKNPDGCGSATRAAGITASTWNRSPGPFGPFWMSFRTLSS